MLGKLPPHCAPLGASECGNRFGPAGSLASGPLPTHSAGRASGALARSGSGDGGDPGGSCRAVA